MDNLNLTPKDILQKEFKPKMRGYDPADVDTYLDNVIKDYESFQKNIQQLKDENERLRDKIDELTKQVSVGKTTSSVQPVSNATNMDILKRLSNLERRVFGSQLDNGENESHRI
ncbi:cell division regulator GpsB [Pediococcus inopinatus]|uniref:Cell cycle protein GpsB n=1 Tax=Pediococcus inopinatus TaxID=114090 RepID=A0ABZ0Q186_9LACO|nr:cell division regulator GpsB [Pediococcus inopinatus]AVK99874.1 cell division protein GpsB [Pediococcus inopinatus]WPC17604.1 cell division regulator GpsB [Pediococcus inopinatus]WPC18974.1 cell division regulator GpsB [Pediococcus inopinatus]WPC20710.1 cell division regulator GpsB [Pediococcus inopinatus]WPP08423.1 cell division regulator GpsB [Pediococcus inopinatus]